MPPQCASHDIFQEMIRQGLANLNEKLANIAEALKEQNETSARKMDQVMESQSERRELCGKRGAEIVALQQSDTSQWEELRRQRESNSQLAKVVWKREGALVIVAAIASVLATAAMKWFMG